MVAPNPVPPKSEGAVVVAVPRPPNGAEKLVKYL